MIRECSSKEGRWQEICTQWQPNSFYDFVVQTEAKDYPFPFNQLQGHWSVIKADDSLTLIQMKFDVEFKHPLTGLMETWVTLL